MFLARKPLFWAVSFGHMTVDMFNGMGPVLMAFLSGHIMPMTHTQIGFAVSAYALSGALSQPLFGWLGDRNGGRWLGAGGVGWTVSLLMLSLVTAQLTQNYFLMLIPFVLASIGSGAFHPVGAMHASESDKNRAATNTSLFFLMGQLGLGIGPVLAGFLLDQTATHNNLFTTSLGPVFAGQLLERGTIAPMLALALIAIPGVLFMGVVLPTRHAHVLARSADETIRATIKEKSPIASFPIKAFVLLGIVVTLRSLSNPGAVAFIPLLFESKGWDATAYGFITSLYWIGGGIAGVIVGSMAERYDSRLLVAVTLCLAAPSFFFLPTLDGPAALALALASGALSGGSHSLLVVQAQSLIPTSKGFATGAILGFMFATGALGSLLIGTLSDKIGLGGAFQVVGVVTFVTGILGLVLPPDKRFALAKAKAVQVEPAASGVR